MVTLELEHEQLAEQVRLLIIEPATSKRHWNNSRNASVDCTKPGLAKKFPNAARSVFFNNLVGLH